MFGVSFMDFFEFMFKIMVALAAVIFFISITGLIIKVLYTFLEKISLSGGEIKTTGNGKPDNKGNGSGDPKDIETGCGSINDKVEKEICSQLASTYDDAPIDGKKWKFRQNIFRILLRLLSILRMTRDDFNHDDITIKVYRRLLLRHSILNHVEDLSRSHEVNTYLESFFPIGVLKETHLKNYLSERFASQKGCYRHIGSLPLFKDKSKATQVVSLQHSDIINKDVGKEDGVRDSEEQPFSLLPSNIRVYNLAVTDLFVEKALAYLNRKARTYNRYGFVLSCVVLLTLTSGILVSFMHAFGDNTAGGLASFIQEKFSYQGTKISEGSVIPIYLKNYIEKYELGYRDSHALQNTAKELIEFASNDQSNARWVGLLSTFVKGFTFYGFLVLLAVFCYRMAKALFDQAERLKDRRHALRQGRLFVHLNGGKMTVDEMEKAFNWNMSSENAFANINPDAQAPWGNVVKEMLKTVRETSKAGIKAAERK